MNLYKELQEKLSEHNPTEVDELILDDIFDSISSFSEANKKDLEKYTNLIHLSLNGFGLESLKNFPKLANLQVLEIRANNLNGSDFDEIPKLYPNLYKLKVGENPIKSLDVFKVLNNTSVTKLEMDGCSVVEGKDNYRDELFGKVKSLEIIDNLTKDGDYASTTNYDEDDEDEYDGAGEGDEDFEDDDEEFEDEEDEEGEDDEDDGKKR